MKTSYSTIQGDTWDMIAYSVYGDNSMLLKLMQANPQYIDIAVFDAGVILNCPDYDFVNVDLPPWKKGTA